MTRDEFFADACDWKDGKCRSMRNSGTGANCCSWCRMYGANGCACCPFGADKPPKCRAFLCVMARTWIAEEGGEELRSAAARLDDDALAMDYEINADRNKRASMGLGLGNALRRALRKNGAI